MKKMKKMASFLLAMLMALALAVPAMAGSAEGDPDPAPATTPHYKVYQIFKGDYVKEDGGEVLSNIVWGQNGKGTKGEKVEESVLEELHEATKLTDDTARLNVIKKYLGDTANPYTTGDETKYTVDPGYYLIEDTGTEVYNSDGTLAGTHYMQYVVQVTGTTLEFTPKIGSVPGPDKKIIEGDDKVDWNEASIGDTVTYELYGTMPSDIARYETYYFAFHDTLSKGLTYTDGTVKVYLMTYEAPFDPDNIDVTTATPVNDFTTTHENGTLTISCNDVKALGATENTVIVARYEATLNTEAVIIKDGSNPNDVYLEYSNDPNHSGEGQPGPNNPNHPTGTTPKVTVDTYTTELKILKVDGEDSSKFLSGAKFTLTGDGVNIVIVNEEVFVEDPAGEYYLLKTGTYTKEAPNGNDADYESTETKYVLKKQTVIKGNVQDETTVVEGTTGSDGYVTFTGLGEGTYTLTETEAPDGYNLLPEPITVKIEFDKENKTFKSDGNKIENGVVTATVVNNKGATLPETGGIGTTIFYVVGGALVVGAVVLLVTKKRMSNIEE